MSSPALTHAELERLEQLFAQRHDHCPEGECLVTRWAPFAQKRLIGALVAQALKSGCDPVEAVCAVAMQMLELGYRFGREQS